MAGSRIAIAHLDRRCSYDDVLAAQLGGIEHPAFYGDEAVTGNGVRIDREVDRKESIRSARPMRDLC